MKGVLNVNKVSQIFSLLFFFFNFKTDMKMNSKLTFTYRSFLHLWHQIADIQKAQKLVLRDEN